MRSVANEPTVIWDFDLSLHKSLRMLEVLASSISREEPGFLTRVLRTITSPAFSEVIIIYRDYNFGSVDYPSPSMWPIFRGMSPAEKEQQAPDCHRRLKAFREIYKVRDFLPMLCRCVGPCEGARSV